MTEEQFINIIDEKLTNDIKQQFDKKFRYNDFPEYKLKKSLLEDTKFNISLKFFIELTSNLSKYCLISLLFFNKATAFRESCGNIAIGDYFIQIDELYEEYILALKNSFDD